jgi:hypothetical protein
MAGKPLGGVVAGAGFCSEVPGVASPPRRPGTIRRTSTADITIETVPRPLLRVAGIARDLLSTSGSAADPGVVLGTATMTVVVAVERRSITELSVTPARWQDPLGSLIERPAQSGFRKALRACAPELVDSGSPLATLLDDLPVCLLISGNLHLRFTHEGIVGTKQSHPRADVCAGWQTNGELQTLAERSGSSPLTLGPPSGELADPADPAGWHDVRPLGEWSMRRARRLDLLVQDDGGIRADAYLRDVRRLAEARPRTVHEYSVRALIDRVGTVRTVEAVPHVLPAPECPQAVASAQRLERLRVDDLRAHVAKEFTGISTCTHLNDMLRTLGDARYLVASDPRGPRIRPLT